ncbi:MAG: MCE family protein [Acidobacteria bacterium]|nr:MCE family protein [Acidobacteriota bacterium]
MPRGKHLGFSELKVGILVLASVAILIFLVMSATGGVSKLLTEPYIAKTRFAEVDGLLPGADVRLAGKRVGNVEAVNLASVPKSPEDLNTVEVVMSIDPDVARQWIRTDSRASLGSIGLLGDKVVDISPGTQNGQPLPSGSYIESMPGTNIRKIISGVDPLISDLTESAEQIKSMVTKINEGQGTLGRLIHNPRVYEDLDRAVLEATQLVKEVREGQGTMGRLINDPTLYEDLRTTTQRLQNVVRQIDEGQGTVARLIKDPELYTRIDATVARLQQTADQLQVISARIERGEGTIGRLINDPALHEETKQTMSNIRSITARLDQGQGTAGALLNDRQLYDNLNQASSQLVRLIYDFRQDPQKYLRVKVSIF